MMAYIKGIGSISPQPGFGNLAFHASVSYRGGVLHCLEPDYTEWIDPSTIRRMSKIIRIGVAASSLALKDAGIEKPDAIITGTGFGCLEDTGIFLNKLIANKEEALNPTPFIQSTHNTIGSQIALRLRCVGYNQTYSQRGHSFECALQDAMMMLVESHEKNILVGGIDEVTDISADFLKKYGLFSSCDDSLKIFEHNQPGMIHGEGSSFFLLSNSAINAWAQIAGMSMIYKPLSGAEILDALDKLMEDASLSRKDIDLVLLGKCGDEHYDSLMNEVSLVFLQDVKHAVFKNLCGEYSTASSFAMWLAAMMLKKSFVPEGILSEVGRLDKPIKTILIYNQYFNHHHSLILLRACA